MRFADRMSFPVRRGILLTYWAGIYFLTHWPGIDRFKIRPDWPFPDSDKFVHASFYAGWIVLWWWVLSAKRQHVDRATIVWLMVGTAAYAIFDELTQAIVGRQPDILDCAFDMVGASLALVVLLALRKRRRGGRPQVAGAPAT